MANCFALSLNAGLVDTVEVAVMPVILGSGIPLLPSGASTKLVLYNRSENPSGLRNRRALIPCGGEPGTGRTHYVRQDWQDTDERRPEYRQQIREAHQDEEDGRHEEAGSKECPVIEI